MSDYECMILEVSDHIATVTLNRPEIMNALNWQAYAELESIFLDLQKDADVRCIILTGAGRAFCSGDDVREIMAAGGGGKRLRQVRPGTTPAARAILDCDRPIIAAVNGAAVGWGMDMSLLADFRIASEKAKFGELFVKRGLVADVGGMVRLPKIIGPSRAAELLFTGEIISAERALELGLVMSVVPADQLLEEARILATKIANNPPLAVRYLKEGLRRSYYGDYEEVGNWVAQTLGVLFQTEDHKEGVASFLEKREPTFTGK
jgi:enoyl-CoA hydratase/carnithine racemase